MRGLIFILLLTLTTTLSASKVISNTNKATKISWEQQVLLQKIMKSYMKLGAHIDVADELKELDASVAQYEENIGILEELANTPKLQEYINEINLHWYKFRLLAITPPNNFDAPMLLFRGEMLEDLNKKVYQDFSKDKYFLKESKEFQTYSNLLILSYELSMYYYAHIWGIDREADKSSIKLKLPKKYLVKRKKIEKILKNSSSLKDANVYSQNTYSILKSYYIVPKKRLRELNNSKENQTAFIVLETKFASLANKSVQKLLLKNGFVN
jgi:hypothetical protein